MTDRVAYLNTALEGRYSVEAEVGKGGMATVYLARDVKHGRQVALKVLRAELGASIGAERFLSEIRLTANLQHPNILPLFDSGAADGLLYYVMPYVRGESLRNRLDRDGTIPVDEAVAIACGIATALDHAHRNGVIHRDVKPANVLMSDGVPVVADFGIARATAGATRVTAAGISLGTPAYSSPEQAVGDDDVDARADIYSLGCVLFEMLAGHPPFQGSTAHAVLSQHLMAEVPTLLNGDSTIPPAVDAAIRRALAKKREERFETAAEMSAALVAPPAVEPFPDYSQITEPVTRSTAPLAGRRKEYDRLLAKLDALATGRGATVFVSGEPGVGKTKLIEALLLEARARGYLCNVGHSYEMEGVQPYLPIVEMLEYAMRTGPPGRLRAVLGPSAAEIARIVPKLRQMFPDIPDPLDLPPEEQRRYLATQYVEFLERITRNVPLVVLFDDLHWADESTLLLLEHMAAHAPHMRILLLGTYRDVDLEVKRPFARTLERMTRRRLVERIALRRMPQSEVADLLSQLGAPDPPAGLVRAIYAETEGNPFFVEEVFRHLQEDDRLLDAEGRWRPDLTLDALEVPEGVKLVIGRRLERVTEACRTLLTSAAIIGPRFDLVVLEEVAQVDPDAVLDALEEAERAGLVVAQQVKRQTRYTFAHELIRQTLIGALSVPRRLRHHHRTAEALERVYAGREAEHAAAFAYHYFEAGSFDEEKTTRYLLLAGRQSLAAGAFDEALAQAEKAFSVMELDDPRRRADLLWLHASALRGLGRWREASDTFAEAFDVLASLEASTDLLALTCTYADTAYAQSDEHVRARTILERALETTPDEPSADRARLMALHATLEGLDGGFEAAMVSSEHALEMARSVGDPEVLGMVLSERSNLLTMAGHVTEALEAAREACGLLEGSSKRWAWLWARSRLSHAARVHADHAEVLQLSRESEAEARAVGHVGAAFTLALGRWVASQMLEPDVEALRAAAAEARRDYRDLGAFGEVQVLLDSLADYVTGDFPRAVERLEGMSERVDLDLLTDSFWSLQFVCAAHFDATRARAILEAHAHRLPSEGEVLPFGTRNALGVLVEGLRMLGDDRAAAKLYPRCVESLELGFVGAMGWSGLTALAAGNAAAAAGDWEAAERHFEAASRFADERGAPGPRAGASFEYAQVLLERGAQGDAGRARALLEEALPVFERAGASHQARICKELLAG